MARVWGVGFRAVFIMGILRIPHIGDERTVHPVPHNGIQGFYGIICTVYIGVSTV